MTDSETMEIISEFMPGNAEEAVVFIRRFNELMMRYNSAIREVKTKLEILNDELSLSSADSPISSIQSRLKKPLSIARKLRDHNLPNTLESITDNLTDVAGIRVICPFLDDIYKVADMLARQDDLSVVRVKDYIKSPKPNGYRSYHMIVEVPVFFSDEKRRMSVEIQIRTVAMDFWASLEHQLSYKQSVPDAEAIAGELKDCAEVIATTDERMLRLRERINSEAKGEERTDII